ncbi:MAG: hypothetical protein J6P00_02270, partial [Acetobacter sp.]|nr:hypothetical protein [Acetobacter sp.]
MVNVENYNKAVESFEGVTMGTAPNGDQDFGGTDPKNFPAMITSQEKTYVKNYIGELEGEGLLPTDNHYYFGDPSKGQTWNWQIDELLGSKCTSQQCKTTIQGTSVYNRFTYVGANWISDYIPPHKNNQGGVPQIAAMNHNGTDESYGGFANVLYDFDLERLFGLKSIATPFIGGGAGYLW